MRGKPGDSPEWLSGGGMDDGLRAQLLSIEQRLNRQEIDKARLVRAIILSSEVDAKVMSACVSVAARRFDDFDATLNEITKLNGQMLEILDEVLTSERDPASQ